jgi:predicted phosphodiesterase/uncharacterized Zn finger protein
MKCPNCASENLTTKGRCSNTSKVMYKCKDCGRRTTNPLLTASESADPDLIVANVQLAKQKQAQQDKNRISNKAFREHSRVDNAVAEYSKALIEVLSKHNLSSLTIKHNTKDGSVGVVHLSDIHFNELVNLSHNKYDFTVAATRIRKHIQAAKIHFKAHGITKVLLAFTADLMNSDRRLDEKLAMATNRSKATFLAVDILQQAILDLNRHFQVTVAGVCGNEGRVGFELGWVENVASDNYDYTIYHMLRKIFEGSKGVTFDPMQNSLETVVNIAGQNLLLVHGHALKHGSIGSSVAQKKAQYISSHGIKIDFVIFGHIHEALISDNFARSGSPVGDNSYSANALNLTGRASQNLYIFHENGNRDGIKVDLQNIEGCESYDFDKAIEAYNPKSADKGRPTQTIFQVII